MEGGSRRCRGRWRRREDRDKLAAGVDGQDFRFSQRKGLREEQVAEAACGGGSESNADTDDILVSNALYSSTEGVESRRKVAEWAAEGWQQPADWGSCLDWIAEQWGAVDGTRPLQETREAKCSLETGWGWWGFYSGNRGSTALVQQSGSGSGNKTARQLGTSRLDGGRWSGTV